MILFLGIFLHFQETLDQEKYNLYGPPHSVSNLKLAKFKKPANENSVEKRLRVLREETQEFHHKFWTKHNTEFTEARKQFVNKLLKEKYSHEKNKKNVSATEMSEFYKSFLDSRWSEHLNYNLEWQRRNFTILYLGIRVKFQKLF